MYIEPFVPTIVIVVALILYHCINPANVQWDDLELRECLFGFVLRRVRIADILEIEWHPKGLSVWNQLMKPIPRGWNAEYQRKRLLLVRVKDGVEVVFDGRDIEAAYAMLQGRHIQEPSKS